MPWKWENSEKTLTLPVDFCRDQFIFDTDTPRQSIETLTKDQNQASWSRKGDVNERCFYVPVDLINNFPTNSNLFRDTIACVTQLYLDQSCPVQILSLPQSEKCRQYGDCVQRRPRARNRRILDFRKVLHRRTPTPI